MSNMATRITVQSSAAATTNAYGELIEGSWSTFTITGANIRGLSATEKLAGSRESNVNLYNFEIHRTAKTYTITKDHRILVADGSIYNIISVDHMSKRKDRVIIIIAEENL
mgnify:CR=1 FL=1